LIVVAVVNFLTEITQNIATCTLMMPILAALSGVLDVHPYGLMVAACIASSCAFMLPVATAPNAVVFGSGYLQMKDMVRAGFVLNVVSIIVITVFVYFLLPTIWGIDLLSFPIDLKIK
jgi:sodium-dependent dicarboxylate transporter 2/3/5